jgi:hypothetical protein
VSVRFLTDENFKGRILRELLRRRPALDIVRAQDVGLRAVDDPMILEWAARQGRALLTYDIETMRQYAYDRVQRGEAMPGAFLVLERLPIAVVIEEILLIDDCSREGESEGQVCYLPL